MRHKKRLVWILLAAASVALGCRTHPQRAAEDVRQRLGAIHEPEDDRALREKWSAERSARWEMLERARAEEEKRGRERAEMLARAAEAAGLRAEEEGGGGERVSAARASSALDMFKSKYRVQAPEELGRAIAHWWEQDFDSGDQLLREAMRKTSAKKAAWVNAALETREHYRAPDGPAFETLEAQDAPKIGDSK